MSNYSFDSVGAVEETPLAAPCFDTRLPVTKAARARRTTAWSSKPNTLPREAAPTATVAVADQLRHLILSGKLQPGLMLHQQQLALRLGVSRMPVSHAFARLESEGLVVMTPHRFACARVAAVSADEAAEIFDLRLTLETATLRHAIPRHTAETLETVRASQRALVSDEGPDHWIVSGQRFLTALYAPSGRALTMRRIEWFQRFVERCYQAWPAPELVDRTSWSKRYARLADSVSERDETAAMTALAEHLSAMQALILRVLPGQADQGSTSPSS